MEVKTIQIDSSTFLVFKGREYKQINIENIVCIKTSGKYSTIIDVHGYKTDVCCSLKDITHVLCIDFILATQGFLINHKYISEITRKNDENNTYILKLNDDIHTTVDISLHIATNMLKQL